MQDGCLQACWTWSTIGILYSPVTNDGVLRIADSGDGDRVILVQELLVAMRSASEEMKLQKQDQLQEELQQQLQLQHEDSDLLREKLEASEARCSTLNQQLQQLQLHSQQLHAEDLRRANTLLQASESRGAALAQQLQVCGVILVQLRE